METADCVRLMVEDHREVTDAVSGAIPALTEFIEATASRIELGGRLVYIGAGTSGRLGVLDASECPPTFQSGSDQVIGIIAGGDVSLRQSSESKEDDLQGSLDALTKLNVCEHDVLLGIAAGGTTPYVLGAIRIAKSYGACTGLLTCAVADSPIAGCDHLIVLETGPEILTGSTRLKAGSATKLALNIITTTIFTKLGKIYGNLMVDLRATNAKLHDRAIRIVRDVCPDLSREEAGSLLDQASGQVKTAIVMNRLTVDFETACQLLTKQHGRLRAVLESPVAQATRTAD